MRELLLLLIASLAPALLPVDSGPAVGAHNMAAMIAKRSGNLSGAVAECRAALDLNPSAVEAHWILAWSLHDLGDKQGAIAQFGEVARYDEGRLYGDEAERQIARLTAPPPPPRPPLSNGSTKRIALTFDDGPDPTQTPRLLDMLAAHHVRATFFVLGSLVKRYPEVVARIVAEGHQVGIHAWEHVQLTRLSRAGVESQMLRTSDAIYAAAGVRPLIMRPTYGSHNATVRAAVGMPLILWDVDPQDWKDRNAAIVRSRVTRSMHGGSIILMHDIHRTTVDAVPGILEYIEQQGYEPVTVSELIGPAGAGSVWSRARRAKSAR